MALKATGKLQCDIEEAVGEGRFGVCDGGSSSVSPNKTSLIEL